MTQRNDATPRPHGSNNNLTFDPLPELDWGPDKAPASANALADYSKRQAIGAIQWYLDKKGSKKRWAQRLRLFAILSAAVAGLLPVLSEIDPLGVEIRAGWATVALALAATAVGLDRFFGFSSAWMRFLTTEMRIRTALHDFSFRWSCHQAALRDRELGEKEICEAVDLCRQFVAQLNGELQQEMNAWVREFSQNLAAIDAAVEAEDRGGGASGIDRRAPPDAPEAGRGRPSS